MVSKSISIAGVDLRVQVQVQGEGAFVSIVAQWGTVSSSTFLTLGTATAAMPRERDLLQACFEYFDVDGDGKISKAEVKKAFPDWSDHDIRELFRGVDKDSDGLINYVEFVDWVTACGATAQSQLKQPSQLSRETSSKTYPRTKQPPDPRQTISRKTVTTILQDDFDTDIQVVDKKSQEAKRVGASKTSVAKIGSKRKTATKCGSKDLSNQSNETEHHVNKSEESRNLPQILQFLANVQLFSRLPKEEHPLLADSFELHEFKSGEEIIKQGEPGDTFYVIKNGEATVTVSADGAPPKKIATLHTGDYFGENALLRDEPRTATITAAMDLTTLKINRGKFKELRLHEKLQFLSRKAVADGGGAKQLVEMEQIPKTEAERHLIEEALKRNEHLQTMFNLDNQRIKEITDIAWKDTCKRGTAIIMEGDLQADYFYVVQEGSFDVLVAEDKDASQSESKRVGGVEKGGSFGELALLYLVPRAATVVANVDSVVWVFDRQSFKDILMKASKTKIEEYCSYLNRVDILAPLLADEKKKLAKALVEKHFTKGEAIFRQGDPMNTFYILCEGDVTVRKDNVEQAKLAASRWRHETLFFGERALLSKDPLPTTVTVCSETAKALALDRDSFNMLLGPLEDIINRAKKGESRSDINQERTPAEKPIDKPREKILRKHLRKLGLLGCGGFGAVELWEHTVTKDTYALKALSKGYVVKTRQQVAVMNEKKILMMTNSPFIIRLWETYNDSQTLYFLMEAALGGELFAIYNKKSFHGNEELAQFYTAGIVLALVHMHQLRIIYRDLKPENVLLNEAGHLKVTDMGLAKCVIGTTFTTCGTPDYFAPEIIAATGHTLAVDWWALGILTFELMAGNTPFEASTPMHMYSKIKKGITSVQFPKNCQGPVGDLIKGLLKNDPSERICCRPGGAQNLKDHEWYEDFEWPKLENLSMVPPYRPVVKSNLNALANFSACEADKPPQIAYVDDGSGWDKDFASVIDDGFAPDAQSTARRPEANRGQSLE